MYFPQASLGEYAAHKKDVASALRDGVQALKLGLAKRHGFRGSTVYVGASGLALALARVGSDSALRRALELDTGQDDILSFAAKACSGNAGQRVTFLEGTPGVLAVRASVLATMGNKDEAQKALQDLRAYSQLAMELPAGECELLYGRAGFLYALLYVIKQFGPLQHDLRIIQILVRQIISEGQRKASSQPALAKFGLAYEWHGSHYLGAAHGICGILQVLLLLCEQFGATAIYPEGDLLSIITRAATALVDECFKSGNLPSSLGKESDRLVQWCHGAPGLIPMLCQLDMALQHSAGAEAFQIKIMAAARKAAAVVWERGLLTKGLGLCHGISGSAYSLLSLFKHTGEALYKEQAEHFAAFMFEHWQQLLSVPDHPLTLYEGLAGAVCLWADILHNPKLAVFPGYEV